MSRLRDALGEFVEPDDFAGRPYGRATNQIGHWAVGLGGFWAVHDLGLGPGWAASVLVLSAGLEIWQWARRGARALDGLTDWVFVLGGWGFAFALLWMGDAALASRMLWLWSGLLAVHVAAAIAWR